MAERLATLDFVAKCREAASADQIAHLLFAEMARCGMIYVACSSHVDPLNPPRGAVSMVSYPLDWVVRFSACNYLLRDPICWGARLATLPFMWDEFIASMKLARDQKQILSEARECGLVGGVTIPIRAPGAFPASCSLVPGPDGFDPVHLPDLHYMAYHAHEAARLRAGSDRLAPIELGKRQHEILQLVAEGKSDGVIAQILGISERTVHHAIEKAKQRYGVPNRTQAVALAVLDGLVTPTRGVLRDRA